MGASVMNYRKYIGVGLIIVATIVLLWGCYPKRIGPVGPDGKKLAWKDMNTPQRKAHMKKAVLPDAAKLFSSWRPDRFAEVDCTLCHGPGAETDYFRMPTDYLPRLSGDLLLGSEFEKHPQTTRLKLDRLVPMMADALGLKSFSLIKRDITNNNTGPNGY